VFSKNVKATKLVHQTYSLGVELYSPLNKFFCSKKLGWLPDYVIENVVLEEKRLSVFVRKVLHKVNLINDYFCAFCNDFVVSNSRSFLKSNCMYYPLSIFI